MKRIILTAILALAALTASAQTLVIYYSKPGETYTQGGIINLKKGNTQEVAERIQKLAKADIFRVETVKNYPDSLTVQGIEGIGVILDDIEDGTDLVVGRGVEVSHRPAHYIHKCLEIIVSLLY